MLAVSEKAMWDSQEVPEPEVMRDAVGGIRAAIPPSMLGSIRQIH